MTLFEKSTSMQIIPFPAHYQLGYHNFDFSSFSRISCNATVALSAFKYGSFASSKDPNEKINGLPQRFKTGFPLWLKKFRECDFVNIIHHHPTTCRDCFLECANNAWIYFPIKCQQSLRHAGRHQAST